MQRGRGNVNGGAPRFVANNPNAVKREPAPGSGSPTGPTSGGGQPQRGRGGGPGRGTPPQRGAGGRGGGGGMNRGGGPPRNQPPQQHAPHPQSNGPSGGPPQGGPPKRKSDGGPPGMPPKQSRFGPPLKQNVDLDTLAVGDVQLPPELHFSSQNRLFFGNLPVNMTIENLQKMTTPFGQTSELFAQEGKNFAFAKFDTMENARRCKFFWDGQHMQGRTLRVRFAGHVGVLRVKNLTLYTSNEQLKDIFSQFGEVEKAIHIMDDKGKPTGEGLVYFSQKNKATRAMQRVNEEVFLIGENPRPLLCEPYEGNDQTDGLPEVYIQQNSDFMREREAGARFVPPGSFHHDIGLRWRELDLMERQQIEELKNRFDDQRRELEQQMQVSYKEFQMKAMKMDLLRRQEELRQLEIDMNQGIFPMGGMAPQMEPGMHPGNFPPQWQGPGSNMNRR